MKFWRALGWMALTGLVFLRVAAAPPSAALPWHDVTAYPAPVLVPWANPLAGGPIRVLAIAPYSAMGDVTALAAHLEVELSTVALWDAGHLGFDPQFPEASFPDASHEAVEKRLTRLLEKQRFDVILIGAAAPGVLPEAAQTQILKHVERGAGLFLTGHGARGDGPLAAWLATLAKADPPPLLAGGFGPVGLSEAELASMIECLDGESARVVRFNFAHEPTSNHCLVPIPANPYDMVEEFESNAFALACRAVLWAARREPAVLFRSLTDIAPRGPDDEEIPAGYPPEFIEAVRRSAFNQPIRPYILDLDGPAPDDYEVTYQIRLPGAALPAVLVNPGNQLAKGSTYYALDVIAAPGDYLLDIWLKNRKGVAAWHTEVITVRGWPQITDIAITQDGNRAVWLKPNDHLDISLNVETMALLASGQDATIQVRAMDSFGRQVAAASQVIGADGGPLRFRLDLADLIAPLVRVEVLGVPTALASQTNLAGQAAREVFYFPVRLPDPPLAPATILSTAGVFDYHSLRQINRLRDQAGVSVLHAPLDAASLLASSKAGLSRIARLGSLERAAVATSGARVPCLSDPRWREEESAAIANGVLQAWSGGAPYYSLGAGCALTDGEVDVCQSPHCLKRFRDALQRTYPDLAYLNAAWGESFGGWDEVVPWPLDRAQQNGVWAPWLDFRRSMDTVFADAHRQGRDAIRKTDPAGRVGFQARHRDITPMTGYDWRQLATVSDFLAVPPEPGAILRLQSFHGPRPYDGVVLGFENLRDRPAWARWVAWDSLLHQLPAVWLEQPFGKGPRSLLSPLGQSEPGLAALAEALDPIQRGLGTLLLQATPQPTGIAFVDSPATRHIDFGDPAARTASADAEARLARSMNRLGFRAGVVSLEAGPDAIRGVNTLVLPRIRALADGEIAALKEFHDRGGLIVADGRPGELDGHGLARGGAPLTFLHPFRRDLPPEQTGLWSNRPVWTKEAGGEAPSEEATLGAILARAGNVPAPVPDLPEKLAGAVSCHQFAYGAATIHAFLAEPDAPTIARSASLKVPDDHFASDLLAPMETTPRGRVQWTVTPGQPAVFSFLPYKVEAVLIEAPEIAVPGQRVTVRAHLDTGEATPGPHLIHVRVEGPDRLERRYYRQTILAESGLAETYIPLAQNEAPGLYDLTLTDLLTGQSAYVTIEVAP